jgi:2-keto-3-deoxy-L-rhamnonate aldolase RhmA
MIPAQMPSSFPQKLRAREHVFGTMLFEYARATVIERLQPVGLDFMAVDMEHASLSRSEVGQLMSAIRLAGMFPLVRVLRPCAHEVNLALDAGAQGVLVPYVETVAEVREVVGAARLRPLKGSHLAQFIRTGAYPREPLAENARQMNEDVLVVIGIESVAAVRVLPRLLRAAAVDGVFVGVWDLTTTLGVPGDLAHPRVEATFRRILEVCAEHGVAAADDVRVVWQRHPHAREWAARAAEDPPDHAGRPPSPQVRAPRSRRISTASRES